jgi:hypothetical protein
LTTVLEDEAQFEMPDRRSMDSKEALNNRNSVDISIPSLLEKRIRNRSKSTRSAKMSDFVQELKTKLSYQQNEVVQICKKFDTTTNKGSTTMESIHGLFKGSISVITNMEDMILSSIKMLEDITLKYSKLQKKHLL